MKCVSDREWSWCEVLRRVIISANGLSPSESGFAALPALGRLPSAWLVMTDSDTQITDFPFEMLHSFRQILKFLKTNLHRFQNCPFAPIFHHLDRKSVV